jgi:hypothetical protein
MALRLSALPCCNPLILLGQAAFEEVVIYAYLPKEESAYINSRYGPHILIYSAGLWVKRSERGTLF